MRALGLALALCAVGCAPIPQPKILEEVDEVARSPAALSAKEGAEPTWARAEKKRLEAHEAALSGPASRAQFLAEEAIATYNEAASQARLAKAALRESAAKVEGEALEKELAATEADLARVVGDVDALSARAKSAKDQVTASTSEDPAQRREADRAASSALLGEATLLCASARLLGAGSAEGGSSDDPTSAGVLRADLAAAEAKVAALEEALAPKKDAPKDKAAPKKDAPKDKPAKKDVPGASNLDAAGAARASCLSVLERTRRSAAKKHTASADALLGDLSAMFVRELDAAPSRDERGVVILLPKPFDGDVVASGAKARLESLDRVASSHAAFPVAIVVHPGKPIAAAEKSKWESRGASVAALLPSVAAPRRIVVVAREERSGSERVEVVFIAPENL